MISLRRTNDFCLLAREDDPLPSSLLGKNADADSISRPEQPTLSDAFSRSSHFEFAFFAIFSDFCSAVIDYML